MSSGYLRRFVRLWIVVGIIAAALLIGAGEPHLPFRDPERPRSIDLAPSDLQMGVAGASQLPVALVSSSFSDALVITPTPAPSPTPRVPDLSHWVRTRWDTTLWRDPDPDLDATEEVPAGSYLRVLGTDGGLLRVFYGGDGDEREAGMGVVEEAAVSATPAPRWVVVRQDAPIRSGGGGPAGASVWAPEDSVLEVLEDAGKELRIFYLGNGRLSDPIEGWVGVSDLGPAGPMLVAEDRGVRVLSRSDARVLKSGEGPWLKVPYRTQLDGSPSEGANCGPASMGMALEYFGLLLPTSELRALANRLQGTWDPDSGVAIEHLEEMARRNGLTAHGLYLGKDFRRWSVEDVRDHLRQGHLVIPQLRYRLMPGRGESDYWGDHYVVLSGMLGNDFIYNDSVDADGPGFGRLMSSETLESAWGRSSFPYAAFAVSGP